MKQEHIAYETRFMVFAGSVLKNCFLLFSFFLISQSGLRSQDVNGDIRVKGSVTTRDGEVLPGVSIKVKGKNLGTITNAKGEFSVSVDPQAVLVITYTGFKRVEVPVENRNDILVVMEPLVANMEEVIVVGYGTVKKSDLTGSVSTMKMSDLENRVTNISEALQGRLAGVQILNNTGEPGSGMTFNIRGKTSVTGNNQPLIVIDGQPVESSYGATMAGMAIDGGLDIPAADPLASINPNDIASIEILKDASSIAIYGSRGANGVVLITTKSGRSGTDRLTYTSRFDINKLPKQLKMLGPLEYMNYRNEAALNDGKDSVYSQFELDSISTKGNNINWQDEVYNSALSQDHQLSFSGKDAKGGYLISGNYTNQNSMINNADYIRYGLRVNYTRQMTKKLSLGIRTYMSLADRNYGQQSNWTGILGSSAVMGALCFHPLRTAYDENGDLDEEYANNPTLVTSLVKDKTKIRTIISNLTIDYDITKNLQYQAKAGVNDLYSLRQVYYPTGTFIGNTAPNGSATRADNANSNFLIDHILTFKKNFRGKHSLNAVGGFSYQKWRNAATSVTNMNFPSDALGYSNFASASSPGRMYTVDKSWALASVISRFNYAFDRRYLVTLTGRYDGASRLAEGSKWNLFPSIGLGWNVSNENFFRNVKLLSLLKLRASYGIAGNENIAVGATQSSYGINYVVIGSNIQPGYVLDNFENPNLGWEKTKQINIGGDFGLANDRLNISVDVYQKTTSDLLINLSLPGSAGYSNYYTNVGEVMNRGVDMEASFNVLRGKKLKWDVSGNLSLYRNEVLDMGPLEVIYGRTYLAGGAVLLSQPLQVAKVGLPISSFWGYRTAGIYQTPEEVAKGPEATTAQPGDIIYVDTNADGQITDADKTVIGSPHADFTYGFTSGISYKNFTFNLSILGSQGNELINMNRWMVGANNTNGNYNSFRDAYEGRWTGPGTSNLYPRLTTNPVRLKQRFPDWMVEDASFIRLQSLSFGYTFRLPQRLRINSIKTFVSGTNLITITDYTGYDPNINAFGHLALSSGADFGTLPQPRTFSAGVEIVF